MMSLHKSWLLFLLAATVLLALACGQSGSEPAANGSTSIPPTTGPTIVPPTPTPDPDAFINEHILALECNAEDFIARQSEASAYVDLTRTSFEERVITFGEGFADTEQAVNRKLMVEAARVLRDFPCIGRIRIVFDHPAEQQVVEVTLAEFEAFAGVDFDALRADINAWVAFTEALRQDDYEAFVSRFRVSDE